MVLHDSIVGKAEDHHLLSVPNQEPETGAINKQIIDNLAVISRNNETMKLHDRLVSDDYWDRFRSWSRDRSISH